MASGTQLARRRKKGDGRCLVLRRNTVAFLATQLDCRMHGLPLLFSGVTSEANLGFYLGRVDVRMSYQLLANGVAGRERRECGEQHGGHPSDLQLGRQPGFAVQSAHSAVISAGSGQLTAECAGAPHRVAAPVEPSGALLRLAKLGDSHRGLYRQRVPTRVASLETSRISDILSVLVSLSARSGDCAGGRQLSNRKLPKVGPSMENHFVSGCIIVQCRIAGSTGHTPNDTESQRKA